jgi:hypothetical protein
MEQSPSRESFSIAAVQEARDNMKSGGLIICLKEGAIIQ